MSLFNIVLIEPEIPQNTGNIGRTCVATNSRLHLVGPMGFKITDAQLKRAGLDYWSSLDWQYYSDFTEWFAVVPDQSRVFYLTTKTSRKYTDVTFKAGDWFVFGKETKGLAPELLQCHHDRTLTIPLLGPARSLNLATSVAIVTYEAIRQISV